MKLILSLLFTAFSFAEETSLKELESLTQGLHTLPSIFTQSPKQNVTLDDTSKKEILKNQADAKTLKILNEQYKKSQKYLDQLQILDLLMPRAPQDISLKLDYIEAQKRVYYHPQPTLKKKDELEKELKNIIKTHPNHEDAYWSLFDLNHYYIEWAQNTEFYNKDFALQNLEFIKVIQKRFGETNKTAKYLCQYLIRNHLYQEAHPSCQKAKNLNPKNPETLIYTDYLLNNQNKKSLLKILKKHPHSVKVYLVVGELFFDQEKYSLSYKYFKKALSLDSQSLSAILGAAQSLFYEDKPNEALLYYVKACGLSVLKTRNLFQKAKSILNQKNLFDIASRYQAQLNYCVNGITGNSLKYSFLEQFHNSILINFENYIFLKQS